MKRSIRRRLLNWLMIPLLVLSLVSVVGSYLVAVQLTRAVFDQNLITAADAVLARVKNDNGRINVVVPEQSEQMLTENKDLLLYDVYSLDGKRLTGLKGLSAPDKLPGDNQPILFGDEVVGGQQFRVVILKTTTSRTGPIILQVGETRNSRSQYRRSILLSIFIPQLILIVFALVAVWLGIGKGLNPLNKVREAVARRSPADLSPLEEQNAPYELRSLITALNGLLGRIKEDMVRQERFAANAAHQLRTPLAGIKTYLELMSKMSKDPELDKMLFEVRAGVDRITRTVQQLLSLSRAEHAVDTVATVIDLNEIVLEAATDVVPESIKHNVELELNTSNQPALIEGEPVSLKELTTNLLENAIRYNHAGGHVNVITINNGQVELIVDDDGMGIPESDREQVFERFYRINRSSNLDVEGSGLGLSIVSEIAKAHGAMVKIGAGSSGKGTRISITFPSPKKEKERANSEKRA